MIDNELMDILSTWTLEEVKELVEGLEGLMESKK